MTFVTESLSMLKKSKEAGLCTLTEMMVCTSSVAKCFLQKNADLIRKD